MPLMDTAPCLFCSGAGEVKQTPAWRGDDDSPVRCEHCQGTGEHRFPGPDCAPAPSPGLAPVKAHLDGQPVLAVSPRPPWLLSP